ncbi:MAG: hydroxypyruvate isomerase family protein [Alphaproteobacteria bacterium]|nr:hydroxypyruvate isomerase family protein [Alphaproteobacteria bacterium]
MPRFAANLSLMFTELPFLERFAAAARCGFRGVEFLFPYDHPAREIARHLSDNGLEQVLFNLPAGAWERGERGFAALPGRTRDFDAALARALDYAGTLGCKRLHVMAGIPDPADAPAHCRASFLDNLRRAAERCRAAGVTPLIEPINRRDIPGYYLADFALARGILAELGDAGVRLQHDLYHAQIIEGDLSKGLERNFPLIGHVQIANPPGRHEPDRGEINFPHLFALLDTLGYEGWIGCEYRPMAGTEAGLGWARPYGIGAA